MKRILIIGTTGSGKSTLAKQLAEKLGIEYIDLDDFHHLPGWKERPREEFRALTEKAAQQESWVFAGNYFSKATDITWPRADTIIWLDLPFLPNFWQLLKRTVRRSYTGEMICNGNYESFRLQFMSKQSLFIWFLKSWGLNRKRYTEIFAKPDAYPHLRFIRLRSHAEMEQFLCHSEAPSGPKNLPS
jgi:adenylate kinase family enzyme